MPTLPWGEQGGLGLGWQGRGRGCPRPEPGSDAEAQLSRDRDVPAFQHCSGLSMDMWWIRAGAGAEVASPADVRAGRRGPCPRGGDQGFAGCLETELMYLQMMMEILFLFFCSVFEVFNGCRNSNTFALCTW